MPFLFLYFALYKEVYISGSFVIRARVFLLALLVFESGSKQEKDTSCMVTRCLWLPPS